jgi:hypothetical protein
MKKNLISATLLLLAATSSYAQKPEQEAQRTKNISCQSIAQVDFQTDGLSERTLHADVPAGGQYISARYQYRLKDGDRLVDCGPGSCEGADVSAISGGSGDKDGATVYDGVVKPQITKAGFATSSTIRLIVTYSTAASVCASESTWPGFHTKAEYQYVYMPAGASYAGWGDFFRRIDYNYYTQCDDSTGKPDNHQVCKDSGKVEFHPVNRDKSDLERGMQFTCSDDSGVEIRCRAQLRYNPVQLASPMK